MHLVYRVLLRAITGTSRTTGVIPASKNQAARCTAVFMRAGTTTLTLRRSQEQSFAWNGGNNALMIRRKNEDEC